LACYKLGTTYGRLAGNLPEAIRNLKRAVELSPQELVYREDLAVAYGLNKQFNEAIQTSEALLKIKPDYIPALMNLSVTYRMLGQLQKADSLLQIIRNMQTSLP
jgi:Flp pilus assembly protein TadD